jgi:putative peptidoglycan lipid II flippase
MADKWILNHYAAADRGGISRLTNAKALFNAPLGMIGAAAGAASLPFFASLFAQTKMFEFNTAVNRAVSRLLAVAFLMTAWMSALAFPIVDLLSGGRYTHADAVATARYFAIFALSLALWSAQGIYARAFYAARNTLVPAVSGTVVTLVSIPVYALLFHHLGVDGLAIASDIGILTHTVALAILLHRYQLVSIASLEYGELTRAILAAAAAYAATVATTRWIPHSAGFSADVLIIAAGSAIWAAVCFAVLQMSGSKLIQQLRNRKA